MNDRAVLYERMSRRLVHVAGLGVVAIAFVGLFTGTRKTPPKRGYAVADEAPVAGSARPAPAYLDWRTQRRGPNADQYAGALAALSPTIDPLAEVTKSESDHDEALEARAEHRAYAGAPPTIPHLVDPTGTNECLACHEQGARLFGRTAPRMSHAVYSVCTQCHVPERTQLAGQPPLAENAFQGLPRHGRGARAWAGAPPTMPHPTHMRTECGSCHGPLGPLGLRTTHPSRLSCTQCHAPSAELDQRPFAEPPIAAAAPLARPERAGAREDHP